MSRFLVATLLVGSLAPPAAHAIAHHEKVTVEKLRDASKKVVGFRVHGIADPEAYNHLRVHIGRLAVTPSVGLPEGDSTRRRHIAAGLEPGYVRAQIFEATSIPSRNGQQDHAARHELQEFHVDVHYGVNNDLAPGDKVDIYSTYNNKQGANPDFWHVFGMHDGPLNQGDLNHVHELPTETSAHGEATQLGPE